MAKLSTLVASSLLLLATLATAFQNVRFQPCRTNRAHQSHPSSLHQALDTGSSRHTATRLSAQMPTRPSWFRRTDNNKPETVLSMSDNDDNNTPDDDDDKTAKKVAGRKKRVLMGYRLSAVIYALLSIATLVPAFVKPQLTAMALNYAGGPVLAGGVAYILTSAATNDRLGSDTYKRLNLMLSKFGLAWLLAAILVTQRTATPLSRGAKIVCNPLVVLASLSATINGIKGWGYGVKGWDKKGDASFGNDLVGLFQSSMGVFVSAIPDASSGIYLLGTLFSAGLLVKKAIELGELILGGGGAATGAQLAVRILAMAKLQLLAGVIFVLMDAAKRKRLSGSTFVELNVLSSIVWLGMGAFLKNVGQAKSSTLAFVFGSFSLLTGLQFYVKNKRSAN
ncbi:expressed unknown protein [Seminavis robusta]|uniref:Uncharacterized protein n=1 Tax=Seminavis robusta TaxID=568900 RepID=A0A9N8DFR5_9STRA|nr:expressed unknown protein [Seminavis robusta]|eukprot:Sro72_g039630.1 n/a (394) ;mRNA; r:3545-4828